MSNLIGMWRALIFAALLASCAAPVSVIHGVPNLHQFRSNYYRSGQPADTDEAWAYLRSLGITDVFKLTFEEEGTDNRAAAHGITVHRVPIDPTSEVLMQVAAFGLREVLRPSAAVVAEIDRLIREVRDDGKGRVVLIQCLHGLDRTGFTSGRVLVWNGDMTKEQAWAYMLRTGFRRVHLGLVREWEAFNPRVGGE